MTRYDVRLVNVVVELELQCGEVDSVPSHRLAGGFVVVCGFGVGARVEGLGDPDRVRIILSSPDAMREKPGVRSHSFLITITRAPVVIVGDVKGCYDRGSPRVRSLVLLRHRAKSIVEVVSI